MGSCTKAVLGVLLPPVAVLIEKGCGCDFIINLLLTICLAWIGGIIHAFHVFGVSICINVLCLLLPPVAVLLEFGCGCDFLISLVLTLLAYIPGVIYSYYIVLHKAK